MKNKQSVAEQFGSTLAGMAQDAASLLEKIKPGEVARINASLVGANASTALYRYVYALPAASFGADQAIGMLTAAFGGNGWQKLTKNPLSNWPAQTRASVAYALLQVHGKCAGERTRTSEAAGAKPAASARSSRYPLPPGVSAEEAMNALIDIGEMSAAAVVFAENRASINCEFPAGRQPDPQKLFDHYVAMPEGNAKQAFWQKWSGFIRGEQDGPDESAELIRQYNELPWSERTEFYSANRHRMFPGR